MTTLGGKRQQGKWCLGQTSTSSKIKGSVKNKLTGTVFKVKFYFTLKTASARL